MFWSRDSGASVSQGLILIHHWSIMKQLPAVRETMKTSTTSVQLYYEGKHQQ